MFMPNPGTARCGVGCVTWRLLAGRAQSGGRDDHGLEAGTAEVGVAGEALDAVGEKSAAVAAIGHGLLQGRGQGL